MALELEKGSMDSEQSLEEVEWNRLKEYRLKEGFVDGKCLGEEKTLKNGYSQGYIKGFEISYPISVIKGLLAVNKMLLKDRKSHLLAKADAMEEILDKFEKKCSECRLNQITFTKNDISSDLKNDNVDTLLKDFVNDDGKKSLTCDGNLLNEINEEFGVLKEAILSFLEECQQPLLLSQISQVLENTEYQQLIEINERISAILDASECEEVSQQCHEK